MKRMSILFVFALLASMSSMAFTAETTHGMKDHKFKAELSGVKVPPVVTKATGEVKFEMVGPGASGSGTGGIESGATGDVTGDMAEPGQGDGYGSGASDPGHYKGIIDNSGDRSSSGSGAGGAMKGEALRYELSVRNIENVTAAHIHAGKRTSGEGPVVAALFLGPGKAGEFNGTLARGMITDKDLQGPLSGKTVDDLVNMIKAGDVYVNVHTAKHPAGEIRGQVSPS